MPTETAPATETVAFTDFVPPDTNLSDHQNKFPIPEDTFEAALEQFRSESKQPKQPDAVTEKKPEPKQEVKPVETKKPDEFPVTDEMTDEALDAQIKTLANDPKGKEALRHKTYELRDAARREKALIAKNTEMEAALERFRAAAPDSTVVQSLQQKFEASEARRLEQETELAATRYEATEEYQKTIAQPMQQLDAALSEFATNFEIDPNELRDAANLKGKARGAKLAELSIEMTDYDKQKFYATVDKYTEIRSQASISATEAKQRYDALMAQRRADGDMKAAEVAARLAEHRPKVWDKLTAQAEFLKDATPEVATRVADYRKFADNADFTQQPIEAQVEIMQRAAVWPLALAEIAKLKAELALKDTRLGELRGATPRAGGDSSGKPAPVDSGEANETFEQRFDRMRHDLVK